jgi:hypothetical protein
MNKPAACAVALLAGTVFAMAQAVDVPIGQNQPDPLARPAAPATTLAPDGVRNGTTKEERDQHTRAGENPDRAGTTILPEPDPRSGCTQLTRC